MDGVLIIDKPQDFTSFDVVAVMRRLCAEKKIGHTGTLDPMATGVLVLLLGHATRALPFLQDTDKTYEAGFRLGEETDTQDATGRLLRKSGGAVPRRSLLEALPAFTGEIWQTPPMYSAVSVGGQRLYTLARQGVEVAREPRPVRISALSLLSYDEAAREGTLLVTCSKGTYIRTLCADLGAALGVGGVLLTLRRTQACGFSLSDAVTLQEARTLSAQGALCGQVRPVDSLFSHMSRVTVSQAQAVRFQNGGGLSLKRVTLPKPLADGAPVRAYAPNGAFLGLGKVEREKDTLSVLRLFSERGATNESDTHA